MKTRIALMALLLFAAFSVQADTTPTTVTSWNSGLIRMWIMCAAEEDTGVCIKSGDEIVQDVGEFSVLTFDSTRTTSSTYSCDVYGNDEGHDAATAAGDGEQLNSTSITQADRIINVPGGPRYMWIECTAINGDGVLTITMKGYQSK